MWEHEVFLNTVHSSEAGPAGISWKKDYRCLPGKTKSTASSAPPPRKFLHRSCTKPGYRLYSSSLLHFGFALSGVLMPLNHAFSGSPKAGKTGKHQGDGGPTAVACRSRPNSRQADGTKTDRLRHGGVAGLSWEKLNHDPDRNSA